MVDGGWPSGCLLNRSYRLQAERTEHKAGTHQKSLHPIVSDLSQLRCEAKLVGQWLLSSIDPRTVF